MCLLDRLKHALSVVLHEKIWFVPAVAKSKTHFAEAFQHWVEKEALPNFRKTGSYSVPATAAAKQSNTWLDKRLEGKELMRLRNASLQELIAGGFGQTGSKLYAIAGNHISQAVLGFTQTTTSFKRQHQLPWHISIPDIFNMQGQVARCYAETYSSSLSATTCSA